MKKIIAIIAAVTAIVIAGFLVAESSYSKEKIEFVESIKADVKWLGADWEDRLFFASNYFDQMYEAAVKLIKKGKAFVCDLSAEEMGKVSSDLIDSEYEGEDANALVINGKQLAYKLNRMLPPDISIQRIERVDDNLHARFSALSRTYHYYLHEQKDPFKRQYSYECHFSLDFNAMNEAAKVMMEYEDFACFCKSHTDVKTTLCSITEAEWVRQTDGSWYFRVTIWFEL